MPKTPPPGKLPTVADRTPVAVAMTREVITVPRDMSVDALVTLLLENHISGAPVVDDAGRPVGMISKTDLLRVHFQADVPPEQVADLMVEVAFTLPEDAPIARAAALMAFEGVHRIPIVSSTGQVIGILSALDVVRWLARHEGYVVP